MNKIKHQLSGFLAACTCTLMIIMTACSNSAMDLQAYVNDPQNALSHEVHFNDQNYTLSYYPNVFEGGQADSAESLIYFALTHPEGKGLFQFSELDFAQKTKAGDFTSAKIIIPVNYGSSLNRLLIGFDPNSFPEDDSYQIRVGREHTSNVQLLAFDPASITEYKHKIKNL